MSEYRVPHCTHWDSWIVGPGRIVKGEVCCKCGQVVSDYDESDCPSGIGKESIG